MTVIPLPRAHTREIEHVTARVEALAARDVAGALRRAAQTIPEGSAFRGELLAYADDLATLARMRGATTEPMEVK